MQYRSLIIALLCLPSFVQATVHTVSNRAGYPAQHATLAAGYAAAGIGDTLYLTPSPTSYGSQTITKHVTIIGGGYANGGFPSQVATISFSNNSSNSVLIGVQASSVNITASTAITNIMIERVLATTSMSRTGSGAVNGLVIRHCVTPAIDLGSGNGSATNVEITNNLFTHSTTGTSIINSSATSVLIGNNVFLGLNNTSYRALGGFSNAMVVNNIFYGRAPATASGVSNCTYSNNLSYATFANTLPPTGNSGSGNIENQDPLFTNVPTFNPATTVGIGYDFTLGAGSPALGSGSGGTDMGLYGGPTPLMVPLDGMPRIPVVTSFDMANPTVGQSGTVDADAEGSKHD